MPKKGRKYTRKNSAINEAQAGSWDSRSIAGILRHWRASNRGLVFRKQALQVE